ncbi:hypothetical protein [Cellulosimicrobium marinum]|uniref:hypothetical protein n=1 Tax=Cellulosimicrobium marinum TaxID=1638992 RepID=UPI001E30A081|nr:hypothetical protein [Cellulosimicrobium marinum]MCB7135362.1 hypothetical protein [Cellulosimicrobium marinum]
MTTTISVPGTETAASPELVLNYAYEREARTMVHAVLDRSEPDVTLRHTGLRRGTLALFCTSRDQAAFMEAVHTAALPLTLESDDDPLANMTYVASGRVGSSYDAENDKWTVTVDYAEVSP